MSDTKPIRLAEIEGNACSLKVSHRHLGISDDVFALADWAARAIAALSHAIVWIESEDGPEGMTQAMRELCAEIELDDGGEMKPCGNRLTTCCASSKEGG